MLLYTIDDVERQFGMSARSRLTRREIHGVLRALRNLDRKMKRHQRAEGEVVATAGEILGEDEDKDFRRGLRHRRYPDADRGSVARRSRVTGTKRKPRQRVSLFPAS